MGKTWIVFIHFHLSHHGDGFLLAVTRQPVIQRLLDQIANAALRIRYTVRQRRLGQPFALVGNLRTA